MSLEQETPFGTPIDANNRIEAVHRAETLALAATIAARFGSHKIAELVKGQPEDQQQTAA